MRGKILVTYATRCSSCREVAQLIGQILGNGLGSVDVRPLEAVVDLTPYAAVILGSTVSGTRWLPEAEEFVALHRDALSRRKVAYFLLSRKLPESEACLAPVRDLAPEVIPAAVGCFAGQVDPASPPLLARLFGRGHRPEQEDWRSGPAVRKWAASLRSALAVA